MAEMPEEIEEVDAIEYVEGTVKVIGKDSKPLIFISYDTNDLDLVNAIDVVLKRIFADKIDTFIAKRDIKAGHISFHTMIQENLSNCSMVLAICTSRSITSQWLWFESGAGFRNGKLIPLCAGIQPKQIGPPINSFQGKKLEEKAEMDELVSEIVSYTGIDCDNCSLTVEEHNHLLKLSSKLDATASIRSSRIEEIIDFALPVPSKIHPVQYVIEAHFPLLKPLSLQNLLKDLEKSRYFLENMNGSKYPDLGPVTRHINNHILVLNEHESRHFGDQVRQGLLVKSNNVTLTQWIQDFPTEHAKVRLIRSKEFIDESAKLFLFFKNLAMQFNLRSFEMRIRLSSMDGGSLLTDGATQTAMLKYDVPSSNQIEIKHAISMVNAEDDYVSLLMHVLEQFKNSTGGFPRLNEKQFSRYLNSLCEVDEESPNFPETNY